MIWKNPQGRGGAGWPKASHRNKLHQGLDGEWTLNRSSTILSKNAASGRWCESLLEGILAPFCYTGCDWQNWNRRRKKRW